MADIGLVIAVSLDLQHSGRRHLSEICQLDYEESASFSRTEREEYAPTYVADDGTRSASWYANVFRR